MSNNKKYSHWSKGNYSKCQSCEAYLLGKTLFSNLPSPLIDDISHSTTFIKANKDIYKQGDKSEYIYTIKDGIVKLSVLDVNAKYRTTSLVSKGMTLGLEVLNKHSYIQNAISLTPVEICKIKLTKEQIESNMSLSGNILLKWEESFVSQSKIFENFTTGNTEDRIFRLFDYISKNMFFDLPNTFYMPTLEGISSIVNVSKENCSRALSKMKKDNTVFLVNDKNRTYEISKTH